MTLRRLLACLCLASLASGGWLIFAKPKAAKTDAKAEWPIFGGGATRVNASTETLPDAMKLEWGVPMGCSNPGKSGIVAGDGLLFGGSP